jgi:hypothetical protein
MSAVLASVAAKTAALKQRRDEIVTIDKASERLAIAYGAEDPPPTGCWGRLRCPSLFAARRARVSTSDAAEATERRMTAAASNSLLNRMVGVRKQAKGEEVKLSEAASTVAARVDALRDRAALARQRAISASQAGRKEEALRELKRAKATEKQLAVARNAQETLERQQDMLEESQLQKELTVALQSTTSSIKAKSKGVLSSAESAIDDAHEARDEVADIAQVFEGLTPADDYDDDELAAELEEMIGGAATEPQGQRAAATSSAPTAARVPQAAPVSFPRAPTHDAREQRIALLGGVEVV